MSESGTVPVRRDRERVGLRTSGAGRATTVRVARPGALRDRYLGAGSILVFLGLWEFLSRSRLIDPLFISSPSGVAVALAEMMGDGSLLTHLYVSGVELVVGFSLAAVVGIPVGMLAGWYRTFGALVNPFVAVGYVTPRIAVVPVIILWFGIGLASKVVLVFLMAVFPMIIPITAAVRGLDENLVRVARSYGATDRQIFTTLAVPAAVPYIIAALQLGLGLGLVGVVVGELYAATAGVGFLIASAGGTFQTDIMFAGVVILVGAGAVGMGLLGILERRFSTWRPVRK